LTLLCCRTKSDLDLFSVMLFASDGARSLLKRVAAIGSLPGALLRKLRFQDAARGGDKAGNVAFHFNPFYVHCADRYASHRARALHVGAAGILANAFKWWQGGEIREVRVRFWARKASPY
jgi:hypothetical protein